MSGYDKLQNVSTFNDDKANFNNIFLTFLHYIKLAGTCTSRLNIWIQFCLTENYLTNANKSIQCQVHYSDCVCWVVLIISSKWVQEIWRSLEHGLVDEKASVANTPELSTQKILEMPLQCHRWNVSMTAIFKSIGHSRIKEADKWSTGYLKRWWSKGILRVEVIRKHHKGFAYNIRTLKTPECHILIPSCLLVDMIVGTHILLITYILFINSSMIVNMIISVTRCLLENRSETSGHSLS